MTLIFTLCSNNYLAQAKVLGDSLRKYHPENEFIIGLVDKIDPTIDYTAFADFTILPVEAFYIPEFKEMERKYSIVELNTSVKPFYFSHLFKEKNADKIIYLDPDIEIFSAMTEVMELLESYNIIITPQNCSPIDDGHSPCDIHLLGTGVFNLGFIALSNHQKVCGFLDWWKQRLLKYGFADERNNMFFDQVWINLVPAFFDNYFILKHPGYNMAPSNLHERIITSSSDNSKIINMKFPLRFYHYSGFKFNNREKLCAYSDRFSFKSRQDVEPLYKAYFKQLATVNAEKLQYIKPYYCQDKAMPIDSNSKIKKGLNRIYKAYKILTEKN